jgi:hypothetical protein
MLPDNAVPVPVQGPWSRSGRAPSLDPATATVAATSMAGMGGEHRTCIAAGLASSRPMPASDITPMTRHRGLIDTRLSPTLPNACRRAAVPDCEPRPAGSPAPGVGAEPLRQRRRAGLLRRLLRRHGASKERQDQPRLRGWKGEAVVTMTGAHSGLRKLCQNLRKRITYGTTFTHTKEPTVPPSSMLARILCT